VPLWVLDFEYVPSLHFAVAPAGAVPAAGLELAELAVDEDFAAFDVDAGLVVAGDVCVEAEPAGGVLAAGGVAAGAEADDELLEDEAELFWTPP
jgi:hypothetical protein